MSFATKETWEYLVKDFLEIRCTLKEPEQNYLLDALKEKGLKAESIRIHHAFSIDDCLVVVAGGGDLKKRLFYHPQKQTIEE